MNLSDPKLQSQLAAEYVLGTMRGAARQRFDRYLSDRADLREQVAYWENALAPLALTTPQAPRNLLPDIERRLGWAVEPQRGWRLPWLPSLAFALVAGISIALWAPWQTRITPDFSVALATEEGTMRWQFAVDKTHNWIDMKVVSTPDIKAEEDLELWLVVDGRDPISLGLLSEQDGEVQRIAPSVDLHAGMGLAVSVEPRGGSPTGKATGPIIAVQLFPTA